MAYSQVEVASSFDCVLKDHNSRQRCNSMASSASFQKNLKELVRDRLCISVSSDDNQDSNSNSGNHRNLTCVTNCQEDDQNNSDRNQARMLDRWAVKQAEEMVSTIPANSSSQGKNLGASSLVQMWEARLHPAHIRVDRCNGYKYSPRPTPASTSEQKTGGFGSGPVSGSSSSKTSPSSTAESDDLTDKKLDCGEITAASASRNEEFVASASSSTRTSGVNEDLFGEGLRIADIIKRLKSDNGNENEQGHSSGICDGNSFSVVVNVNSLKIRGRQAFNDLLVQMEQERQRELNSIVDRHSVSKFSHRGRIQSMLRVRSLERGVAIQNRQREQYQSARCATPSHTTRSHHGSTIMSLRERFNRGIGEDGTSSLTPRSSKENENCNVKSENRTTLLHRAIKSNHCGHISVTNQQATTSKSCIEMEKCIIEDDENDHVDNLDAISKSGKAIGNCTVDNTNSSTVIQVMTKTDIIDTDFRTSDLLFQTSEALDDVLEENSEKSDLTSRGTSPEDNNLGETSMDDLEGNEIIDGEQDFEERDYDWFSDIARPRSYWEDLRKGWYQQMLTSNSEDNEIKQLLQRKTVSSFLESDFREKMDRMVQSHVQIQASHEDEELEEKGQKRMGQLIMSLLRRQSQPLGNVDDEQRDGVDTNADDDEEEEEEEEEENEQVEEQESANPLLSWNYSHHQQVIHDPEHILGSSEVSVNHPSSEMELKGQIEQLQREMCELRKAVQACLEMQSQLRSSIQPEAAGNLNDTTRKDSKCCICCDKQVDAFLYRCGHMCTCVRCANELQWTIRKCPICRDPILDVVRAFIDS